MPTPTRPDPSSNSEPRLAARLTLARFAIVWELVWPALWPAVFVITLFLALALFDLPPRLPGWLHAGLLTALGLALIAAIVLAIREFRVPTREAARRRLETESGLAHRPLAALEDKLAGGDEATAALWQAHQARMADSIRSLRIGTPRAGLLRRDPYALRAALALALILGAIDAGNDGGARIARALHPGVSWFGAGTATTLDIWVNPPQYTGLPPLFLGEHAGNAPVSVPAGSTVLAQVHGGSSLPKIILDQSATPMDRIDGSNFKGQTVVMAGSHLTVSQGWSTLGSWPLRVIPDKPPTVSFAKPPTRTARSALRLDYDAEDDYGVESVTLLVHRADNPNGEALSVDLSLPDQHLKHAQGVSFNDLTAHQWAGQKVRIQIQAADALGQTGASDIIETVLPERNFTNPIARAIIDQRKELFKHPDDRQPVAETLADLSVRPGLYNDDIVAFLALRTAAARLYRDRDGESVEPVEQLLWDTAVRIEDGRATQSQQDLRTAMQALQDALARNAPQAEIERLMQELQRQMDRYLQSLAQNAQRQNSDQQPMDPSRMLSSEDLKSMLDRMRDLSRTGARDQAREMLSQLQNLLENLRGAQAMQMPGQQGRQGQSLGQMQDMLRRQQQLLDRSFRQSRGAEGQSGQNGAADQDALRKMLGEMMRQMGEQGDVPQSMGRAERAMRNAIEALKNGQPGQAIGPQTEALDALQQAARGMAEAMMRSRDGTVMGDPGDGKPYQAKRDPFGRLLPDDQGEGGVDNGGQMRMGRANDYALQKAKEILDELRRRAGEAQRPELERDYIDRLLKEF